MLQGLEPVPRRYEENRKALELSKKDLNQRQK